MKNLVLLKAFALRIRSDEEGVTAVEYGLIAALIGVAIIGAVNALGLALGTGFTTIAGNINN